MVQWSVVTVSDQLCLKFFQCRIQSNSQCSSFWILLFIMMMKNELANTQLLRVPIVVVIMFMLVLI